MDIRFLVAGAAALAAAACATPTQTAEAPAAPPADRDCFFIDNISGYGIIDERTVRVSTGVNRDYALTLMSNASQLRYDNAIAVRATTSWICTGNGLGVEVYSLERNFQRSWPVTAIVRLEEPADEQGVEGS